MSDHNFELRLRIHFILLVLLGLGVSPLCFAGGCPPEATFIHDGSRTGCVKSLNGKTIRVGVWTLKNANGTIREERSYWDGVLHGVRKRWDNDGRPAGFECYLVGERRDIDECTGESARGIASPN